MNCSECSYCGYGEGDCIFDYDCPKDPLKVEIHRSELELENEIQDWITDVSDDPAFIYFSR